MNRISGYVLSLLAAGTVVVAALPACATNDQSLFIKSVLGPSANRVGGACVYTNDPQQNTLTSALLDIALADSYSATFLVGNQLIPRGDPANNRAESNRAHLNGGIVRVTEPDGSPIREFTSLGTGFTDPQNNNNPGFGSIGIVVFDALTRDALAAQLATRQASKTVLINVKIFGTTLGGVDLESGEYQFPLNVCRTCLITYDGTDRTKIDPADPQKKRILPNCDIPPDTTASTSTSGPCIRGQDLPVSCKSCKGQLVPDLCDPSVP